MITKISSNNSQILTNFQMFNPPNLIWKLETFINIAMFCGSNFLSNAP